MLLRSIRLCLRAVTGVLRRRVLWIVVLTATIVGSSSRDAQAQLPIPIPLPNPLGPISSAIGAGAAGLGVSAFDAIIKHLFAPVAHFVNVALLGWLVRVPDFSTGNVRQLESTVCATGAAALGAVATIAIARYWLAGMAGGGANGFEALEGLARTIGAALFLPLWPWLFDTGIALANLFTRGLMGSGSVSDDCARLLAVGLGAAGALAPTVVGDFLLIVIAVLASLLFLGLLMLKLVVSMSTVLVFVAMPAAVVLWPIPACAWLARLCARAFAVCLLVPICWALCFAATAAVGVDALEFNASGALNALLEPLVAIMLLYVTLTLPRSLARVAMLGGSPFAGGMVSRAVGYAAGRTIATAAGQHLPGWAGGRPGASASDTPRRGEDPRATVARGALTAATGGAAAGAATAGAGATAAGATTAGTTGAAATGAASGSTGAAPAGSGASGLGSSAAGSAESGSAVAPTTSAYAPPEALGAGGEGDGLQAPSFHGREHHHALELLAAEEQATARPVSSAEAAQALADLPSNTRRGIGGLVHQHGAGAREHLAYQALGEWSGEQREALRTLAAAAPDVRAQAVAEVLGDGPTGRAPEPPRGAHTGDAPAATPAPVDAPRRAELTGPATGGNALVRPGTPSPPPPREPADRHAGDQPGDGR
jgi:hypothetical protein